MNEHKPKIQESKIEEETNPNQLKTKSKYYFIIGIFSFGFNFITTAEYVFFRSIMKDADFTSATEISILLGISLITLCLGALFGGILNDMLRTKFGQRSPQIFIGSLITSCIFLNIPLITNLIINHQIKYGLLIIFLFISHFALGIAYSPWLALITDLFSKKERFNAGIAINIFSAIGAAISILLFSSLVENNFSWLIWIITGCVFGFSAISTSLLIPKTNPKEKSILKIKDFWKIPQTIWQLGGRNWILLLVIGMFWAFSSHLVETSIVDSLINRFNVSESFSSLSTNILMGGYIVLLLVPIVIINNRINRNILSVFTSIVYFLFCLLLAIMPKFHWIYFIVLFGAIGNILLSTLQISLPAERVPRGKEASFLGVFFVLSTITKPFGTVIQGLILENKETNTDVMVFGGYPWVFLLAGLFMLIAIIPLSFIQENKAIKIKKEKCEKRFIILQ